MNDYKHSEHYREEYIISIYDMIYLTAIG